MRLKPTWKEEENWLELLKFLYAFRKKHRPIITLLEYDYSLQCYYWGFLYPRLYNLLL